MDPKIQFEFTNDTLVLTSRGVERLEDILHRPVAKCLWAVKWKLNDEIVGITFHKSHKLAKEFASVRLATEPVSPARLVDVSDSIYECVEENNHCQTCLKDFSEALTYQHEPR